MNSAVGIGKVDRDGGGTVPWTLEDLEIFTKVHSFGTTVLLCHALLLFTACRGNPRRKDLHALKFRFFLPLQKL